MKKRSILFTALLAAAAVIGGAVWALTAPPPAAPSSFAAKAADAQAFMAKASGAADFYDYCLENGAGKEKIEQLRQQEGFEMGYLYREALIAAKVLPADMPRITLEDAQRTLGLTTEEILAALNKTAGVPDYAGGSGIHRTIYFLNNEGTEAIYVYDLGIMHHLYEENGQTVSVPLSGGGNVPAATQKAG